MKWEEEFDKRWPQLNLEYAIGSTMKEEMERENEQREQIKDFIRELIS